ncbi:MAG: hypothetical protein RTU30_03975 [Candidatus Thorarchaeota archaeon]
MIRERYSVPTVTMLVILLLSQITFSQDKLQTEPLTSMLIHGQNDLQPTFSGETPINTLFDNVNDIDVADSGEVFSIGQAQTGTGLDLRRFTITKWDSTATFVWHRPEPNSADWNLTTNVSRGNGICTVGDSIFIVGAELAANHNLVFVLMKWTTSGSFVWKRNWDYNIDAIDEGFDVDVAADGSIYCVGRTYYSGIPTYSFLLKFNQSGELQWNRTCGGLDEFLESVEVAQDDSIYTMSNAHLIKWNSAGTQLFDNALQYTIRSIMAVDSTGTCYTLGFGGGSELLMKWSPTGALNWNTTIGPRYSQYYHLGLDISPDDIVYLLMRHANNQDIYLMRYTPNGIQTLESSLGYFNFHRHSLVIGKNGSVAISSVDENRAFLNIYEPQEATVQTTQVPSISQTTHSTQITSTTEIMPTNTLGSDVDFTSTVVIVGLLAGLMIASLFLNFKMKIHEGFSRR